MTRNQAIGLAAASFIIGLIIGGFLLGRIVTPPKEVVTEVTREVVVTQEVIVTKEVVLEPTPKPVDEPQLEIELSTLTESIRNGEVDVGEGFGMASGERYHNIHATVLGLDCMGCHGENISSQAEIFFDQDTSPNAPGPVNRNICLGCHKTGFASLFYYSRSR